jgi:hypothetical protein
VDATVELSLVSDRFFEAALEVARVRRGLALKDGGQDVTDRTMCWAEAEGLEDLQVPAVNEAVQLFGLADLEAGGAEFLGYGLLEAGAAFAGATPACRWIHSRPATL